MIEKRWRIALIILIAFLCVFLVSAKKPWDEKLQKSIAKREAAGKSWRVPDYASYYLWLAAAANLGVAGSLLVTTRWWARPITEGASVRFDNYQMDKGQRRWFWIGVSAAVIVAGIYRVPRLGHSFWNDEEYAFRTYVFGEGAEANDGGLDFEPVTWEESLFQNKINNHIVCTVVTRLSHSVWKLFAGDDATFSETAVRIVPMLASLGSLVALAYLLARIGSPIAGVAAAFFLAFDPWHIRYSVEARGYAYVFLFITLSVIFLLRALGRGRGRNWIAYAVLQALAFLSFPGIVFELAMQNGIALIILLAQKKRQNAGRLLVANALSAMAAVQIFLPSVPQAMHYFESTDEHINHPGIAWVRDWWSHAVEGIPWASDPPELHNGSSVMQEAVENPGTYWEAVLIIPLLALIGLIYISMRQRIILLFVISLLGGSALALGNAVRSNTVFHSWYIVYSVIAVAILAVFGVKAIAHLGRRRFRETHIALQVLFIGGYALFTVDPRYRLVHNDRQPIRQAVQLVRGESPAFSESQKDTITASFGTSRGMIKSYDPRNHICKSLSQFKQLIERARRENKLFFVYHCGYQIARNVPDDTAIQDRIETSGDFEQIAYVKGLEEMFSYHIYRLKP